MVLIHMLRAFPPMYSYLYKVKLLVNEIDLLADDFYLLIQQEFIYIEIGRAMCWDLLAFWLYNRDLFSTPPIPIGIN
jgi:hypothetical protein